MNRKERYRERDDGSIYDAEQPRDECGRFKAVQRAKGRPVDADEMPEAIRDLMNRDVSAELAELFGDRDASAELAELFGERFGGEKK